MLYYSSFGKDDHESICISLVYVVIIVVDIIVVVEEDRCEGQARQ